MIADASYWIEVSAKDISSADLMRLFNSFNETILKLTPYVSTHGQQAGELTLGFKVEARQKFLDLPGTPELSRQELKNTIIHEIQKIKVRFPMIRVTCAGIEGGIGLFRKLNPMQTDLLTNEHLSRFYAHSTGGGSKKSKPLSYAEFARRAGFSSRAFARELLIGKRRITASTFAQIAKALGLKGAWKDYFQTLVMIEEPTFRKAHETSQEEAQIRLNRLRKNCLRHQLISIQ